MKTVFEHIEHIKGKPHHIRKRFAFSAAASVTVLIASVWLVGSLGSGAFAIAGSSFADSTGQSSTVTAGGNDSSALAGAAAALPAGRQGSESANAPARIEIIDAASSTAGQKKAEQTMLPF